MEFIVLKNVEGISEAEIEELVRSDTQAKDEVFQLKAENVRLQNRIERLELVQRRLAKDLERAQS